MNVKQSFKLAIKSISTSKFRSFLTMLGIIIGVAAVIVLVSLVDGFSKDMTSSFEAMGTNLITVSVMGRGNNTKITPSDMMNFASENDDVISAVSPLVTVSATIKRGSENLTSTVYGASEYYDKIKSYEVESGRFIQYIDIEKRQKVCVIGKYIANELFPSGDIVGEDIKINGDRENRLPGNANISFKGVNAQKLLFSLDELGICASAGSACSTGDSEPSHVLTSIGLSKELSSSTLRTSFGYSNTKEDIDFLVESLQNLVAELRK